MSALSNRDLLTAYLKAYESKDLAAVAEMFSEQVNLRDWEICVHGRIAALHETRKNFDAAQDLKIVPLRLIESERTIAAELQILINGEIDLRVVDVVEFDDQGRILSIRAYKGRPEAG